MPRSTKSEIPSALDELGLVRASWLLQTEYSENWEKVFQENSTTTFAPFMALVSEAAHWWSPDEEPPERVEVPWWAVDVLSSAFMIYWNAQDQGLTTSFGEAFGMEAGGQGKAPQLAKIRRMQRDRDLALWVALSVEQGMSVTDAKAEIADRFNVGDSIVKRAWEKYGKRARECLANFRRCNTSRSPVGEARAGMRQFSLAKGPKGSQAIGKSTRRAAGSGQKPRQRQSGPSAHSGDGTASGAPGSGSRPRASGRKRPRRPDNK